MSPALAGFPGGSAGKRICPQLGRPGFNPWVGKIPSKGKGYPSIFCPGDFHGLCSSWGHKELDITERLSLSLLHWQVDS